MARLGTLSEFSAGRAVSSVETIKQASKRWLKRGIRSAIAFGAQPARGIGPEHWGLERNASGALSLQGHGLPELGASYGTPLHVVSAARLHDNARRFLQTPPDLGVTCEVFYSYKTNPIPGVLSQLHGAGVGAEVISHYELWLALELGVPSNKIIYNGPAKSEASVRLAIQRDIELLNLNHRAEMPVVARIAAELGRKPRIGVRVTFGGWAAQFGTAAAGDQALRAYEEALGTGQLDVVGLHVHRGGMLSSAAELSALVDSILGFCDLLRSRLGLGLSIIDVGGGLASRSVRGLTSRELRLNRTFFRELEAPEPAASLSIEAYLRLLCERVGRHYQGRGEPAPRLFLEPGRAMTSDAQLLLTKVLSIKEDGERTFAILDAGINLAESCRSEFHQVLPAMPASPGTRLYTLVGPICTPGDTLCWAVRLPELKVGDTLAVMDAGAYFVPFSTSFSFPRPAVVLVDAERVAEIRRAETFADLVSYDLAGPSAGSQGSGAQ